MSAPPYVVKGAYDATTTAEEQLLLLWVVEVRLYLIHSLLISKQYKQKFRPDFVVNVSCVSQNWSALR